MWPFKKKEFEEFNSYLQNSFDRVKQDTQNISQWISHLHQKTQEQENLIQHSHQKIQQQEQHISQLHQNQFQNSPQQYYQHLHQRIEQLSQKVDRILDSHNQHNQKLDHHSQKLDHFHQKITELGTQRTKPKHSFKEKIVQTFSRHSKNYLKNLIFNYLAQHQKISALQLKDIIVDQQGLASKSTFYRILTEIEQSNQVTVIKDGKQKIFLLKTTLNQ